MARQSIFLVISILLGLAVGYLSGEGQVVYLAGGAVFGALVSGVMVALETSLQRLPARMTLGGGIGLGLGVFLSGVLIFSSSQIFSPSSVIPQFATLATLLIFHISA